MEKRIESENIEERKQRKLYKKPEIEAVRLTPSESVLNSCITNIEITPCPVSPTAS